MAKELWGRVSSRCSSAELGLPTPCSPHLALEDAVSDLWKHRRCRVFSVNWCHYEPGWLE